MRFCVRFSTDFVSVYVHTKRKKEKWDSKQLTWEGRRNKLEVPLFFALKEWLKTSRTRFYFISVLQVLSLSPFHSICLY